MFKRVRTLNDTDKALLVVALLNSGIKARIRKLRIGFRVVFEGSTDAVATVLNNEGFLTASGEQFGRFSFNGANEVFVRYARF
ncbi:hypothetical protein [Bradyrhizobium liaoningense]